jgi:RNA polymerase sigma-70 factor (sigma-E family)
MMEPMAVRIAVSVPVAVVDRDEALRQLFEEQYRSLVRLAAVLTDDRESAEDVVQEAFVRMYLSWGRLRDLSAGASYLRSIVLNLARSGLRRRLLAKRRGRSVERHVVSAEDDVLLREDQRAVLDALRSLPRRQRECLTLRYYLDWSEAEIAAGLGISAGSVKSHSSRGVAALAATLEAGA